MKPNWKGIYPALTTKFTDDDQLDIHPDAKVEAEEAGNESV